MSEDIEMKHMNRIATENLIDDILTECDNLHDREYCAKYCGFTKWCDNIVIALDAMEKVTI